VNPRNTYYGQPIGEKLKRTATDIPNPCDVLQNLTRSTKKGKYHKVKDGVALLPKLDLEKLKKDFADVEQLLERLSS
jgi:hypothetical protein